MNVFQKYVNLKIYTEKYLTLKISTEQYIVNYVYMKNIQYQIVQLCKNERKMKKL